MYKLLTNYHYSRECHIGSGLYKTINYSYLPNSLILVFLAEFRKRDFSAAIKDFTVTNGT